MTNKDWIKRTIAHEKGVAVPYNMMFSPPIIKALQEHYDSDDIFDAINLPIRDNGCTSIKPLYASPAQYGESITDEFGVVWSTSYIDRGSPVGHAIKDDSLSNYKWPDAKSEYRFEGIGTWLKANTQNFTMFWAGDLWERATFMLGMEQALIDLHLNPMLMEELFEGIKNYIVETMKILFERFEFDCVAISDDYGTQSTMVMSPQAWRKFIKPRLAEIYGLAKANGRHVFHHSCGQFYPIIPDLIEIGLDVLHPIQPEAMDIYRLKREFGKDLTFCGGLNTQHLLPKGTPAEIQKEVKTLKERMGAGGGYILEPGITIQADVPIDNVLALIQSSRMVN